LLVLLKAESKTNQMHTDWFLVNCEG